MPPILRTGFGVGDILLATSVLKALRRVHGRKYIVETQLPELFENNPNVSAIWREGTRHSVVGKLFDYPVVWRVGSALNAFFENSTLKCGYPFPSEGKHLIDAMAESVRVSLRPNERRPFLFLTDQERHSQSWAKGWIAVQHRSTTYWTPNKNWVEGRMQSVVDELNRLGYSIVHLGSAEEKPLRGVKDMRGKVTLRQTAAILSHVQYLIGLEGGLVHLARSVNTRSIVIYTGYTRPEETGYGENINLRSSEAGEGCWRRDLCEHCRKSAAEISVDMVVDAALRPLKGETFSNVSAAA